MADERTSPQEIESKWQARWDADQHWYAMTPSDARARYKRMTGHNVLFPMGFDAFGLPAENAAIKRGIHPMHWTQANIENMRGQLRSMGAMFDWQRETVSCDPKFYRWTQWLFTQEKVKTLQTNWIGKSTGANVTFRSEAGEPIEVFTTRPDTLWGVTFVVLAPEHPLVNRLVSPEQRASVESYVAEATRQTEIERAATDAVKTGVFLGAFATNPVNGARLPIWVADYVLMTYGTASSFDDSRAHGRAGRGLRHPLKWFSLAAAIHTLDASSEHRPAKRWGLLRNQRSPRGV